MIEALHDVFVGTCYILGSLVILALVLFMIAVVRAVILYLRGKK